MISSTLAFFAGFMLTWPALIILVALGVLAEHNDSHKMSVFLGLVAALISYFFFELTLASIALYAVGYVIFGLVWSVWRYKRHADNVVARNINESPSYRERALQMLHPTKMLSALTSWVLAWPFSVVGSVCGDLINLVQTLVTRVFRGAYMRIFQSAVEKLTPGA